MNIFNQNIQYVIKKLTLMSVIMLTTIPLLTLAGENDHDEEVVVISDSMARASGIDTVAVSAGQLNNVAVLFGDVTTDPASLSHIRARFDGVISDVTMTLGDKVTRGDTLATVESNESLKRYPVTSPFTGTIIARHANTGELSNGQILFSIANYDDVWAQLKIFPNQRATIKSGQKVWLSNTDFVQESSISHIVPSSEGKPYTLAFVKLNNADGNWPVGALTKAQVITATKDTPMLIPKSAIQEFEGQKVVFVKKGTAYQPRPISLGLSDSKNVEVLQGLENGELIVSQNSYLIKADLEKSEAGHEH
ncbi:MAG: cobalt-zinc-cadmium efflux system membrane fusion protein [Paraglaciecola sp.]|jgi:cobalt-zinc-cadmium efflux system membrane fusion protein